MMHSAYASEQTVSRYGQSGKEMQKQGSKSIGQKLEWLQHSLLLGERAKDYLQLWKRCKNVVIFIDGVEASSFTTACGKTLQL